MAVRLAEVAARCERAPLRCLAYALIAVSFVFMALPWLDLAVSHWFAGPDGRFDLAADAKLVALREVNRAIPKLLLPTLAIIVLVQAFGARVSWLPKPHAALYVFGVYAIGSGAVVNVLKNVIGRARPEETIPFGGPASFSIPWQFADGCLRNCSFASGEAGAAAAMMAVVVLVPPRFRQPLFTLLLPAAVVFSLLRVAFGRHFISDVVISWLLVALVAVLLWRVFSRRGDGIDRTIFGAGRPLARVMMSLAHRRRGRSSVPLAPARNAPA